MISQDSTPAPAVQFTSSDVEDARELTWDVVVIGAGVGGGSLAFELARQGRKVCLCELGLDLQQDDSVVRGKAINRTAMETGGSPHDSNMRLQHGKYPEPFVLNDKDDWLAMGSGTGGGSSTFGNVMDRMFPADFEPLATHGPVAEAMLPERWPISYQQLEPHYRDAERLFRVRGTWDPLRDEPDPGTLIEPVAMSHKETVIETGLRQSGLNPYRIHYAYENAPGCMGCPGVLCDKNCRNDAEKICVQPAVQKHGAGLLTRCRISRLVADGSTVTAAVYRDSTGEEVSLRSKIFVLAAGALASPALLLRSGLANSSGLVGCNLMFHVSDIARIRTKRPSDSVMTHGLSLNDFYHREGQKLGNVHIHKMLVTKDTVEHYLGHRLRNVKSSAAQRVGRTLIPTMARVGAWFNKGVATAVTVVEDLPYRDNRVTLGDDGRTILHYHKRAELLHRSKLVQTELKERTQKNIAVDWVTQGVLNPSHMTGTLRFGDDPKSSVLDPSNRAHDLDNLYVVDSSFFPTSGGINPSLTIAANALRVAGIIQKRL